MTKVQLGENSRVCIKWRVKPVDYTDEEKKNIIAKFAKKYGIKKEHVTVDPEFISTANGTTEDAFLQEAAQNINDPVFFRNLLLQYLTEKDVKDYDFELITKIDDLMNTFINVEAYEAHKKYRVKWLRWSNFMSYGPDNYIDLTSFKGLVHLSSEPANQGGKTTFCIDLLRFLLFGKVTSRENNWVLARVFNDYLPEATSVVVEGCITIDGEDYVIKRTVTRPALKRRSATSKVTNEVRYYRFVNGEYLDLCDENDIENAEGISTRETNKVIKEAIGNERDFDLMICVNSDNLKELVSLKDAERGRLIARWIGLLPLEDKDKIARDYFNKSVQPKLTLNKYNRGDLEAGIEELEESEKELSAHVIEQGKKLEESDGKLTAYREKRDLLLQSKLAIDEELTNIDKQTVETERDQLVAAGKRKAGELAETKKTLEGMNDLTFDEADYKAKVDEDKRVNVDIANATNLYNTLKRNVEDLKKGEFCPLCGSKLKDVDNSAKIAENEAKMEETVKHGKELRKRQKEIEGELSVLEAKRTEYQEKLRLQLVVEKYEVDLENMRVRLKEKNRILKDLEKNDEAIRRNNKLNADINVVDASISVENGINQELRTDIESAKGQITANRKIVSDYKKLIAVIAEEEKLVRNWKLYLEMVGKNGIAKMVLRSALPLINGELSRLLNDVCDFDVTVEIDNNNDVSFYKIHNGVKAPLGSASGFENTVASLALRSVLSKMSTFSKPSFVVFDEVLGGIADENYDNVKKLYDLIAKDYEFIFHITHLKQLSDWHTSAIVVKKVGDVSTIETVR